MQSREKSSSLEKKKKEKEMKILQSAKCETAFIKEGGWENTKRVQRNLPIVIYDQVDKISKSP